MSDLNEHGISQWTWDWAVRAIREGNDKGEPVDLAFWDWDGSYSLHRLPTRIEGVPCFFWDDFRRVFRTRGWDVRHETARKYQAWILEKKG